MNDKFIICKCLKNLQISQLLILEESSKHRNFNKQLGRINIFPNMSSENCTFTVSFKTGKWLISQLLLPNCEFPNVIIRHNIGPISAANSRLLLLGQ